MTNNIRECVVCGLEVDTKKGAVIRHTPDHGCKIKSGAGHYSHALCLDPDSDLKCAACVPTAAGLVPAGAGAQQPDAPDGRDYVDFPVEQTHLLKLRKHWIAPLVNFNRHREDISDPVALVRLGPKICPVPWLLREKKIGLHHILQAGGLMDDFLNSGYKIGDLQHFRDLDPQQVTKERCQRALEAMGLTAEHLRDYREALPIDQVRSLYGLTPQFIHENLGLEIDRVEGIIGWRSPPASGAWKASDLAYLGFSYRHLCNMGLACREHWDQLLPTQSDIQALGAEVSVLEALPYCLAPPPSQQQQQNNEVDPLALSRVTAPVAAVPAAAQAKPARRKLPFALKR